MQSLAEPGTEENPYQKGNSALQELWQVRAVVGSVDSAAVRPGAGEGAHLRRTGMDV